MGFLSAMQGVRKQWAVEEVITAQQNLAIAQGHLVRAHAAYAKALIQYQEVTGTLLERHNNEMSEAVNGEVRSVPNAPGTREPAK